MEWVDVKLQSELADAARMLARERDVTVSQLMRDLVTREIVLTQKTRQSGPLRKGASNHPPVKDITDDFDVIEPF